jgi:hypothetical protein
MQARVLVTVRRGGRFQVRRQVDIDLPTTYLLSLATGNATVKFDIIDDDTRTSNTKSLTIPGGLDPPWGMYGARGC